MGCREVAVRGAPNRRAVVLDIDQRAMPSDVVVRQLKRQRERSAPSGEQRVLNSQDRVERAVVRNRQLGRHELSDLVDEEAPADRGHAKEGHALEREGQRRPLIGSRPCVEAEPLAQLDLRPAS
jgi:hypothetical protein